MYKIGILGNGVPLTFRHIHSAIKHDKIPNCKLALALSNHPDVPLFGAAAEFSLPHAYLDGATPAAVDAQALALFREHNVDFIILIGYALKIGPALLEAYPDRILNLHSAPLPRFGGPGMMGARTQAKVLEAGVRWSGPTVHLVDAEYDHGQILMHWPVPVRADDTPESLLARCGVAGRELYVRAIADFVHRLDHPDEY